jgi:small multidrug resistance family-3 protein
VVLILYSIVPTWQAEPACGRVYAAYAGVFMVLAMLWGWDIDRKPPDLYDAIGAGLCLVGIAIIMWNPRP